MTPKKLKTTLSLLVMTGILTASNLANSSPHVRPKNIGFAGNGCTPANTIIRFNKNRNKLTVRASNFYAETGHGRKQFDRVKCDISVAVNAPRGYQVRIKDATYRGYVSLPRGASAKFNREYFFAGERGPRYNSSWVGRTHKMIYKKDKPFRYSNWSRCGAKTMLRMKAVMKVKGNGHYASAGILKKAHQSSWSYTLDYRRCR